MSHSRTTPLRSANNSKSLAILVPNINNQKDKAPEYIGKIRFHVDLLSTFYKQWEANGHPTYVEASAAIFVDGGKNKNRNILVSEISPHYESEYAQIKRDLKVAQQEEVNKQAEQRKANSVLYFVKKKLVNPEDIGNNRMKDNDGKI